MVKRWVAFLVLCLLARGWALAHFVDLPQPVQTIACEDAAAHGGTHAGHLQDDGGSSAGDSSVSPDCRIACDLGHAPALPGLWLPMKATALPTACPMGRPPLQGVGPWPPELPPPARG